MRVFLFFTFLATTSGLYSSSDDVVELTVSNFRNKVLNSNELWFVKYYVDFCSHCQRLAPEWKKAASALKGVVNVGSVDSTLHGAVGTPNGIKGFPTIMIFADDKTSPSEYKGARSAQAIVDSAISHLKTLANQRLSGRSTRSGGGSNSSENKQSDVVKLTDNNFDELVLNSQDMWLVKFFAPWCGYSKRLEPEYASAATQLKGKVKVGAVDATAHVIIARRFRITGYPTILVFPAGVKTTNNATEYEGSRSSASIVAWAMNRLAYN